MRVLRVRIEQKAKSKLFNITHIPVDDMDYPGFSLDASSIIEDGSSGDTLTVDIEVLEMSKEEFNALPREQREDFISN